MNKTQLLEQIKLKRSFLCVGLDPDLNKIPTHLLEFENPILEFNKRIIDATSDLCVAYKPNTAFFECYGVKGWETLTETWRYIPESIFTIADAKRGDIGNTSARYAESFFNEAGGGMSFDAITVAPYMGQDSVSPFLNFDNKWVILLALTSNPGSADFQFKEVGGKYLFEEVLETSKHWGTENQMMYVVGATQADAFLKIREIVPDHFLLVPGVGAQGGSLAEVCKYGLNAEVGLLVNSARNIIYASSGKDFDIKAREEALKLQREMSAILDAAGI